MKLRFIIIGLTILFGAAIGLRGISNAPVDKYRELLLENVEALAQDEDGTTRICIGEGSIECPEDGKTGNHVKYLGLRDEIFLY